MKITRENAETDNLARKKKMSNEYLGTCCICGEEFYKHPDRNWAEVEEGEICDDCMCMIIKQYWKEIKKCIPLEEIKKKLKAET